MLNQFTSRTKFITSMLFFTARTWPTSAVVISTHQPNVIFTPGHIQYCILRVYVYRSTIFHALSKIYG